MLYDYDLIIVGGGVVGAVLICALKNSPLKIAVIEAVSPKADLQPSYDDRGLSISLSSKNILNNLGLWQSIAPYANPIKHIHVSDQHHFGFVRMEAETMGVSALGYVVLARALGKMLIQMIATANNIDFLCPATVTAVAITDSSAKVTVNINGVAKVLHSKLLVAADGTASKTREMLDIKAYVKDYQQLAIVSNVLPSRSHADTAYERFTTTGSLALLPHSKQRCVLVFTVMIHEAEKYLQMEATKFLQAVLQRFGRRLGTFSKLGHRKGYPLKMLQVEEQVKHRTVILGNAAHTVHPNGAQGFNLGLRDAVALAEILLLAQQEGKDIGDLSLLQSYCASRVEDQQRVLRFTDRLAKSFYNKHPSKIIVRNLVMLATDLTPILKHRFTKHAMGFWDSPVAIVSRFSKPSP